VLVAKFVSLFAEPVCLVIVVDDDNLFDLTVFVLGPFMIVDANSDVAIRVIFLVIFLIANIGAAETCVA
jgi:hypothetical protein